MDLTYLVNPSEKGILEHNGDRLPLGLLYIAKELETHGHPVKVFDLNHESEDHLMNRIVYEKPTMIGVSCYTSPMVTETKRLLSRIDLFNEQGRVIVGGYHPTFCPDDFTKEEVDNVIIGEGEYAAECLVSNINGFIKRGANANLETLGKPSRHLLNHKDYNMQMNGKRTSTMITSRGCPNSCVFCGNLNKVIRYHRLEDIALELAEIKQQGYEAVYFLDDVFTLDQERAYEIGNIARQLKLPFRVTTRANYLKGGIISDLASNGCDIVSMGVESGSDEVLDRCSKGQRTETIRKAVTELNNYGIKSKGFYVIGLPGETEKTARQTIDFSRELKGLGMVEQSFYPLCPFPGTAIWTNPEKYGIRILDRDYSNYLQAGRTEPKVVCETKDLKADDISKVLREAKQ